MSEKIVKKRKREIHKISKQRGFNILHFTEKQIIAFKGFVEDHVFEPEFGTANSH